jgi:F0F1-type ATP synthase membrane subunit a
MLSYHRPCLTFHLPLCPLFVKALHLKFDIIVIELQTFIFIMCSVNTLIEKKHEATNQCQKLLLPMNKSQTFCSFQR